MNVEAPVLTTPRPRAAGLRHESNQQDTSPARTETLRAPAESPIAGDTSAIGRECVRQHLLLTIPLAVVDLLTLAGVFAASCALVAGITGMEITRLPVQMTAVGAIGGFLYAAMGLYHNISLQPIDEFKQLVKGSTLAILVLAIANASFAVLSASECWAFGLAAMIMLVAGPTSRSFLRRMLRKSSWWQRPVIVVGNGTQADRLCRSLLEHPGLGFRPVGLIDDVPETHNSRQLSVPYLGQLDAMAAAAVEHKACWVIVAMSRRSSGDVQRALDVSREIVPNVVLASNMHGVPALGTRAQECGDSTGIHLQGAHLLLTPRWVKRLLDLAVIAVGAIFVVPLMIVIAVAIKIVSPSGPVFFGHTRLGQLGTPIRTWKFRTMIPDADRALAEYLDAHPDQRSEWKRLHKLKNDPRVIPYVGKVLRKLSLDELPQLWNVVKGEMSLVGPRPIVADEVGRYAGAFSLYAKVRPGITGLWQISGRNNTSYQERIDLDIYYVNNWSPWLDLYILVRTIRTVLFCEGAY